MLMRAAAKILDNRINVQAFRLIKRERKLCGRAVLSRDTFPIVDLAS
jgi:hypothetical protein